MKILVVLALFITLSSAYVDTWTLVSIANSTQSLPSTNSPGVCSITQTYTDSTKNFQGTFTCVGLKANISAVHMHNITLGSSLAVNTGKVISDCVIVLGADLASGSFNCNFTDTYAIDCICNDQVYWNIHTDSYVDGEVRANLVSMRPLCNLKTALSLDGTVVVPTGAVAPKTGIQVADFYVGYVANQVLQGTGGAYVILSWDSVNQALTISGCTYGLTSDVYYIDAYFTNGDGSYFYRITGSTFPTGRPFSFKSDISFTEWDLASFISGKANILIKTSNNPTTGELQTDLTSTNFPSFGSTCFPYVGLKYDPNQAISCQQGSSGSSNCYLGDFCAISPDETKTCSSLDTCYKCNCGASTTDLPTGGYLCCDSADCNKDSFSTLTACTPGSTGSTISFGVFISLFAVLFMKWFN